MIPWWVLALLVLGINFVLWGSVGLFRLTGELVERARAWWREHGGPARAVLGVTLASLSLLPVWGLTRMTASHATSGGAGGGQAPVRAATPGTPVTATAPGDTRTRLRTRRVVGRRGHGPGGGRPPTRRRLRSSTGAHLARHHQRFTVSDVAVLIPAHNEAVVIGASLKAIMALVPRRNVHVVSDGSTDDTVRIAREAGAKVIETHANVGKAGALEEAIERFRIIRRFRVLMVLDADTRVQPGYFAAALPMFDLPGVVAVAGCVRTAAGRRLSFAGKMLVSHRQRIYAVGQRLLKFGQTWQHLNATHIVPGFASMYRTEILPQIEMNPPGLVIEDFNMTFEVYQKRLGKVGFSMGAVAVTQDPDNFHDYVKQTRRWSVGLWQTVRRHPPRASLFTFMLALLLLELVTSSVLYLLLPVVLAVLVLPELATSALSWPVFPEIYAAVSTHVTLSVVLLGTLIPDLALTVLVAAAERQPRLLLFGIFFPFLRLVDAAIGLTAIPIAWRSGANGRWQSPARRAAPGDAVGLPGGSAGTGPAPVAGTVTAATAVPGGGRSPAFVGEGPHASG